MFHVLSERVVHAIWGFFVWFFLGVLALAVMSAACGSDSKTPGGPGSPTSPGSNPPPPPGAPASGGFAAGIGGAGQTAAAHFLIAAQVPGSTPFPTVIGSTGMLTAAKATVNPVGETNPMSIVGAIDPTGSFLYQAEWSGLTAFTIDRQSGNVYRDEHLSIRDLTKIRRVAVDQFRQVRLCLRRWASVRV